MYKPEKRTARPTARDRVNEYLGDGLFFFFFFFFLFFWGNTVPCNATEGANQPTYLFMARTMDCQDQGGEAKKTTSCV